MFVSELFRKTPKWILICSDVILLLLISTFVNLDDSKVSTAAAQ